MMSLEIPLQRMGRKVPTRLKQLTGDLLSIAVIRQIGTVTDFDRSLLHRLHGVERERIGGDQLEVGVLQPNAVGA